MTGDNAMHNRPTPFGVTSFSNEPCTTCGFHHELGGFRIGAPVRVIAQRNESETTRAGGLADRIGEYGLVLEWRNYGGPLWYRVKFLDGKDNFDPCELEAV